MRHELYHVHRWDAIWNELAIAARAMLFFHPAVWYGVRKMQFDRELACDLAVVARYPARRAAYAECLVRFARLNAVPESSGWGIDFAASAHHLTVRVHSILAASKASPVWMRTLRIASGVTICRSLSRSGAFAGRPAFLCAPAGLELIVNTRCRYNLRVRREHEIRAAGRRGRAFPLSAKEHRQGRRRCSKLAQKRIDPRWTWRRTTSAGDALFARYYRAATSSAVVMLSVTGNKGATSQTIALVDTDAKGQPVKSGDRKQDHPTNSHGSAGHL